MIDFSDHSSSLASMGQKRWWQNIQWQEQERSRIWLINQFCFLVERDGEGHGDVMSSLNIQVWWWTGSFSPCLLCRLSNGLTSSFLWRKINTKTAHAFCHKPALIQIKMPHEDFGLHFCISVMIPSASWEVYRSNDKDFLYHRPYLYMWSNIVKR